ncbi:hypothetical protein HQ587_06355 [bacterium]|nr:hypothetical protein [bacterium]
MSIENIEPQIASPEEVTAKLEKLKEVDKNGMLEYVFQMPEHILQAAEASVKYDEGDIPLDRSRLHIVGLGGSAISGELLTDMLFPQRPISLLRGTKPPRDKRGVIVASYSGDTREILELAPLVTGGLRTVIFITSGGRLSEMGRELSIPIWKVPSGFQPRAAIGWSLSLALAVMERWRVVHAAQKKLIMAATRLKKSLEKNNLNEHILVRAALPIADSITDKYTVIFHSTRCTGAAARLAAQINENANQPAYTQLVPEALHNTVQGLAGGDPKLWTMIFMSNSDDLPTLRDSLCKTCDYFKNLGFTCLPYPAAGDDQFELTLSRLLMGDLVSLFVAANNGTDPTPVDVIIDLKKSMTADLKPDSEPD